MKRTWVRVGWGVCVTAALVLIARGLPQGPVALAAQAKKQADKASAAPAAASATPAASASPRSEAIAPPGSFPSTHAASPSEAAGAQAGEHVVYAFPDEEKFREFTTLSQQRQGILLRMSVLRAYWSEEQANLNELDNKLSSEYHLNMSKAYSYDSQRRALIEHEVPSQQAAPTPPSASTAAAPVPAAPSQ